MPSEPQKTNGDPRPPRQAVILIHGIGEQRPMATLRSFVDAFLEPGGFHSKPDKISGSYELRRIKLRRVEVAGKPGHQSGMAGDRFLRVLLGRRCPPRQLLEDEESPRGHSCG